MRDRRSTLFISRAPTVANADRQRRWLANPAAFVLAAGIVLQPLTACGSSSATAVTDRDPGQIGTPPVMEATSAVPSITASTPDAPLASGSGTEILVGSTAQLRDAVAAANVRGGKTTIILAAGRYTLDDTLYVNAPDVTIASVSGMPADVTIEGDAMSATARVGNLIRVAASGFQLRGVTLQRSGHHLVQIAGEFDADRPTIRDCILRDSYEQMLKVSRDESRPDVYSDGGLVENCIFEYSAGIGPQYYIGGVDAHGARDWVVRGNTFRDIASPGSSIAEFAIHFWSGSSGNLVERNTIVDCDRGIGFGMDARPNRGGIIRNNFIHHAANDDPYSDVGISLIESPDTVVHHNTILLEHAYPSSIEFRFASTRGVAIANNLANRAITSRDGASANVIGNVTTATRAFFRLRSSGDLHLAGAIAGVVDAASQLPGVVDDLDGQARPNGGGFDIGADEL